MWRWTGSPSNWRRRCSAKTLGRFRLAALHQGHNTRQQIAVSGTGFVALPRRGIAVDRFETVLIGSVVFGLADEGVQMFGHHIHQDDPVVALLADLLPEV